MTESNLPARQNSSGAVWLLTGIVLVAGGSLGTLIWINQDTSAQLLTSNVAAPRDMVPVNPQFELRRSLNTSGFALAQSSNIQLDPLATPLEIARAYRGLGKKAIQRIDKMLAAPGGYPGTRASNLVKKASYLNYEGHPDQAYQAVAQALSLIATDPDIDRALPVTLSFYEGVCALRRGENENCILCRGESSCILPISPGARHTHPEGSRLAIRHFTEYLSHCPNDLEVRWLLNLAHMTLGEHPARVDPRYLISLDHFTRSEFDIGRFRDIGDKVGVNHIDQAGGAIMDDFDNDGRLDIFTTTFDAGGPAHVYLNEGTGKFRDVASAAGLDDQPGGINCVQADYNNDGYLDVFVMRGGWLPQPLRPTLLRNNRDGSFTDVTKESGLLFPANSIAASWADYDNDGWLDLFVCCERQLSRLYHNEGNGTFRDVVLDARLDLRPAHTKGSAWLDYDNDNYPDLFVTYLHEKSGSQLFHNNRDGTFTDASSAVGISGPKIGFSCWAWDYNNDGWQDLFVTSYDHTLEDVVKGLLGQPHSGQDTNHLYRNRQGQGFDDVTRETGLDLVFSTMGSNFADFDNDGYLDFYLGTGDPELWALVPNRMFKNVGGQRFADITATSGTGNLQKGHGVACGDWDRDGNVDIFIEMGGAIPGDEYHNILFQNPGSSNHSVTLKLVGVQSNRSAIGARIKVVAAGPNGKQTIYRHVSSGSSFGANPLEQTIGVGAADRIESLEIHWPTSNTTQTFNNLEVNQSLQITEFQTVPTKLPRQKIDWNSR